jgi:hypothetical protein
MHLAGRRKKRAAITFIRNYINYCRVGAGAAASCRERCLEFWRELNFASDHDSAVGSDGCGGVEAEGSWREARRLTVVPHTHTQTRTQCYTSALKCHPGSIHHEVLALTCRDQRFSCWSQIKLHTAPIQHVKTSRKLCALTDGSDN